MIDKCVRIGLPALPPRWACDDSGADRASARLHLVHSQLLYAPADTTEDSDEVKSLNNAHAMTTMAGRPVHT